MPAALVLSATVLHAEVLSGTVAGPADRKALLEAYSACLSKPAPGCRAIGSRAVAMLADDLRNLGTAPNRRYASLFVRELKAGEPELRAAAADALGMAGATADETPALLVALNDPVPAVRSAALIALSLSKDSTTSGAIERYVKPPDAASLSPQKPPDAQWLGVRPYPATTYSFASSNGTELRWEYLTQDPLAKVVAFYKTGAKKGPLTADELRRAYSGQSAAEKTKAMAEESGLGDSDSAGSDDSGMPSAETLAKAMALAQKMSEQMQRDMAGKTPEQMNEALTKGAAAQATPLPIDKYENSEAFGSPRFLVLDEATYLGSLRPLTYVVVYEDKAFRKTGIAILKAPE
jgi:hypothetical protein